MNKKNETYLSLSQLIRQRREAMCLNQAQVAAELHVGSESVCLWEAGRRRMQLDKLPRVAVALKLNAADLCRLALFEWHPRLYATLFGLERPRTPKPADPDQARRFAATLTVTADSKPA